MGKRALKNQSKVSVSPLISHGQFHRTKTELTTSKKLSKSLSNDTISNRFLPFHILPQFHHVHPSLAREVCLLC